MYVVLQSMNGAYVLSMFTWYVCLLLFALVAPASFLYLFCIHFRSHFVSVLLLSVSRNKFYLWTTFSELLIFHLTYFFSFFTFANGTSGSRRAAPSTNLRKHAWPKAIECRVDIERCHYIQRYNSHTIHTRIFGNFIFNIMSINYKNRTFITMLCVWDICAAFTSFFVLVLNLRMFVDLYMFWGKSMWVKLTLITTIYTHTHSHSLIYTHHFNWNTESEQNQSALANLQCVGCRSCKRRQKEEHWGLCTLFTYNALKLTNTDRNSNTNSRFCSHPFAIEKNRLHVYINSNVYSKFDADYYYFKQLFVPSSKFCTHTGIIASEIVPQALNMAANSF